VDELDLGMFDIANEMALGSQDPIPQYPLSFRG